jgi:hypothetical protein
LLQSLYIVNRNSSHKGRSETIPTWKTHATAMKAFPVTSALAQPCPCALPWVSAQGRVARVAQVLGDLAARHEDEAVPGRVADPRAMRHRNAGNPQQGGDRTCLADAPVPGERGPASTRGVGGHLEHRGRRVPAAQRRPQRSLALRQGHQGQVVGAEPHSRCR